MRVFVISVVIAAVTFIFGSSCKEKCFECTRKCYTCNKGAKIFAGCEGDSLYIASSAIITGSVDTWKTYLESDSFTCVSNDMVEDFNICGKSDEKIYTDNNFTCKEK